MNDRELLEMAAKAAGITKYDSVANDGSLIFKEPRKPNWNPLTDDGDALRLAVKLNMEVFVHGSACRAFSMKGDWGDATVWHSECGGDMSAATRRAIVSAAAEIGKAIP